MKEAGEVNNDLIMVIKFGKNLIFQRMSDFRLM